MILVDGLPFPISAADDSRSSQMQGREILASLLEHQTLIASSNRLVATAECEVSPSDGCRLVYVFQQEYATVDPALVQLVGTDEATTCIGVVIRNKNNGLISVSHMDIPGVVDNGLNQMLSSLVDTETDLDVHLIGGFDDAPDKHIHGGFRQRKSKQDGFSLPLCSKIVEALHACQRSFHLQTLCVLQHNTRRNSYGNAVPIVGGFVVDTRSGSILRARFVRNSRGPDEIIRRIRPSVSSEDRNWQGKLLKAYNTNQDRFQIAPFSWTLDWGQYASSLLQLSDSEILLRCSTSPYAEPTDFVETLRRNWNYLIRNPDWRKTFIGNKARNFQRSNDGGWLQCQ